MEPTTKRLVRDYGGAILVAVAVALGIRFFLLEAYRIPTPAMRPALEPGDTIFVAKWPFGMRFPGSAAPFRAGRLPFRGEVVVFAFPSEPKRDYIKRVIGLPGETVEVRKGHVTLDGKPLFLATTQGQASCGKEKLPEGSVIDVCWEPPLLDDLGPEKVPEGSVFVIGDLRTVGMTETRKRPTWGMVPVSSLKGKALWVWLSIEPAGLGSTSGWFPKFRFDRMLRRIE